MLARGKLSVNNYGNCEAGVKLVANLERLSYLNLANDSVKAPQISQSEYFFNGVCMPL